jgi:hypothetical protein
VKPVYNRLVLILCPTQRAVNIGSWPAGAV